MLRTINFAVCSLIAMLALIAVVYKAYNCGITHDEAYSFLNYTSMSSIDIISFDRPYTNSHILNTLLMKWSAILFGHSIFALRLPNVLCFIPYMFCSYYLFKKLKNQFLVIPAFIMMVANPFLLDFFSLARGYGLAISLITCSIYFYVSYLKDKKWKFYAISITLGGISVLANFTSMYYLFMLIAFHFSITIISFFIEKSNTLTLLQYFYKYNKVTLIFIPIYVIFMYEPFRRFLKLTIDFGGSKGIWEDTVMTLVYATTYRTHFIGFEILLQALVLLGISGTIIWWAYMIFNRNKTKSSSYLPAIFIQVMLAGILLQSFLLHQLKGTPYLTDRMALFLVPIFCMGFIFLLDQLKFKWIVIPVTLICSMLTLNTIKGYSGSYYYFWNYDADNNKMLTTLKQEYEKQNKEQIQLGISWYLEPALNYYRITKSYIWLKPLTRDRLLPADDYCYILWEDSAWVANKNRYQLIEQYPLSNTSLYKVMQK